MKNRITKTLYLVPLMILLAFAMCAFVPDEQVYAANQVTVEVEDVTESSITLRWSCDAPKGATVKIARNPNNRLLYKGTLNGGVASGTVTDKNLSKGTECQYRVAVYDKSGKRIAFKDIKETTLGLGSVKKLDAYPGYKSITLGWTAVKGAKRYRIERWDSTTNKKEAFYVNAPRTTYRDRSRKDNVTYAYSIWAEDTNGERSEFRAKTPGVKSVRQMYQTIWLKSTTTLSAHAGGSGSRTFSPNTAITATGFGGGKFKFWYGGKQYFCSYTRVRRAVGDYIAANEQGYPNKTANNFANELTKLGEVRKSPRSPYFIWVSTYTQHLYVFRWNATNKAWTLINHWECATGKPTSPTIINKSMNIQMKARYDSGIPYWSCFSGWNGIHGKASSYVIDGHPHSKGCVRNYNHRAEWIYYNCPVGTPVCIY